MMAGLRRQAVAEGRLPGLLEGCWRADAPARPFSHRQGSRGISWRCKRTQRRCRRLLSAAHWRWRLLVQKWLREWMIVTLCWARQPCQITDYLGMAAARYQSQNMLLFVKSYHTWLAFVVCVCCARSCRSAQDACEARALSWLSTPEPSIQPAWLPVKLVPHAAGRC